MPNKIDEEQVNKWIANLKWAYSVCPRHHSYLGLAEILEKAKEK